MIELKVSLDFECCGCEHKVHVTLRCEGKGLAAGPRAVAAVNVPCPTCGSVNHLVFEPSGKVRAVKPYTAPRAIPEPSLN